MSNYSYQAPYTGGPADWPAGGAGAWADPDSQSQYNPGGYSQQQQYQSSSYQPSIGGSSITLENPYASSQSNINNPYGPGYGHTPYTQAQTQPGGYPPQPLRAETFQDSQTPRSRDVGGKLDDEDDSSSIICAKFACLFHTICTKRFFTKREWLYHVDSHLPADRLPDHWPKVWQCQFPNCRHSAIQSYEPFGVWNRKLQHIADHLEAGEDIRSLREEHAYLRIYREHGLVAGMNDQFGVHPAQQWRNNNPIASRNAPDFSKTEEYDRLNEQADIAHARASEGNAQYPQDRPYSLQRAQTFPAQASNNPMGYNDPQYQVPPPSLHGATNPYYDQMQAQRPPFEHHSASDPVPQQPYPLAPPAPGNYHYQQAPSQYGSGYPT